MPVKISYCYAKIVTENLTGTLVKYWAFTDTTERDEFIEKFEVPNPNNYQWVLVMKSPISAKLIPTGLRTAAIQRYKNENPRFQDFHIKSSFLVRQGRGHSGPHHYIEVEIKLRLELDAPAYEDLNIGKQFERVFEILCFEYGVKVQFIDRFINGVMAELKKYGGKKLNTSCYSEDFGFTFAQNTQDYSLMSYEIFDQNLDFLTCDLTEIYVDGNDNVVDEPEYPEPIVKYRLPQN